MKRRPKKPGRKRDTYDRLNAPVPQEKRDASLTKVFDGFFERLQQEIAKVKEDGRG